MNKCFFFEKSSLNFGAAQDNCQQKFFPYMGKLFEPTSTEIFQAVHMVSKNNGLSGWILTGFEKLDNNGNVSQSSDGSPALISPWTLDQINNGFPSQPYIWFHTFSYYTWDDDSASYSSDSVCERVESGLFVSFNKQNSPIA